MKTKSFIAVATCLLLLIASCFSAGALEPNGATSLEQPDVITQVIEDPESGITIVKEITIEDSLTRSSSRTVTTKQTYTRNGNTIAVIAVTATFSYNGSTVSVTSKSVSQRTTYNGWKFTQNSLTSSGGTVSLSGKLTKLLNPTVPVNLSITCDKNGNIT